MSIESENVDMFINGSDLSLNRLSVKFPVSLNLILEIDSRL